MEEKNRKNEQGNRKKASIYKIGFFVFLAAFLCIAAVTVKRYTDRKAAEEKLKELAESTNVSESTAPAVTETPTPTPTAEPTPEESSVSESAESAEPAVSESEGVEKLTYSELGIDVPMKDIDWESLYAENEDIYAWIYLPPTPIDYPVLQHPTDPDYYLNRNIDLSEGYPGCIYSQCGNSLDFTDPNTVLYGHNMYDNMMFTTLHWFEGKEFFEETPYVYIYLPGKVLVYQIYAAYTTNNMNQLTTYDYSNPVNFQAYLDYTRSGSRPTDHYRYDIELTYDNHILTLSTCVDQHHELRYLVQAVLMNEADLS